MYYDFSIREFRDWRLKSCILIAAYYLLGVAVIGFGHENILTENPILKDIVMLAADWMPVVIRGELGIIPSEEMMLWRATMIPAGIVCVAVISAIHPSKATAACSRKINGENFRLTLDRMLIVALVVVAFSVFTALCMNIMMNGVQHDGNKLSGYVSMYSSNKLLLSVIGPLFYLCMNFFTFCAITTIGIAAYLTLPAEVTGKKYGSKNFSFEYKNAAPVQSLKISEGRFYDTE